jgi:hypothetical protein
MAIDKPRIPPSHPDRLNECQKAIKDRLLKLFGEAVAVGWSEDEVFATILAVADNTQLAMHKDVLLSTETELRKIMKKRDV